TLESLTNKFFRHKVSVQKLSSNRRFGLHFFGGALNRLDNMLIAGAAAEVPLNSVPDFFFAGIRISLEKLGGSHDHARGAIAALQSMVLPKALLHRMEFSIGGKAFNRSYLGAIGLHRQQRAGLHRLSIDE